MQKKQGSSFDSVLITGASGFLGQAVSAELPGCSCIDLTDLDLTDGAVVLSFISKWKPQVVVHLAARVGGITANVTRQADFLLDNVRIDGNLLSALRNYPPKHLISMLSTCIYPDKLAPELYPMTEDFIEAGPPPPTNAGYAAAKRALWHGTRALYNQYGIPYTALVPANLYGPGDHFTEEHSHFIAAAVNKIVHACKAAAPTVEFMGTGTVLRQYVFVKDVAKLIAYLIRTGPLNDTVNVAPGENRTIRELAELTGKACGYTGTIVFTGQGPDGQFRKDATSKKLQTLVPAWKKFETSFEEGITQTVRWYRENVEVS